MADSTRPPPPKTGGGAFIAAAIVMLLLMGGLIYWKVSGNEDEPKPVATPRPAEPPPPVLEAPPPPPPPLEDVEDAGKKVARGTGKGPLVSGACGPECKGTVPSALNGALASKGGSARGCYERALRQNTMLQGKIMVGVRVGSQGQVCSASIVSNTVDPGVGSCVLGIFKGSSFPPPNGGCVDVQVPMNFVPKTGPGT
jgi:outer membrane biosynthesis protein TonB